MLRHETPMIKSTGSLVYKTTFIRDALNIILNSILILDFYYTYIRSYSYLIYLLLNFYGVNIIIILN
jgi:hypothetical protein